MTPEEFKLLLGDLKARPQYEWLPCIFSWVKHGGISIDVFEKLIFDIMVWRNRIG